jgi:hypothetical protein
MPWLSDNSMWEALGTRALMLATYEGRRRFHHVCYDWLDETLGVTTSSR